MPALENHLAGFKPGEDPWRSWWFFPFVTLGDVCRVHRVLVPHLYSCSELGVLAVFLFRWKFGTTLVFSLNKASYHGRDECSALSKFEEG